MILRSDSFASTDVVGDAVVLSTTPARYSPVVREITLLFDVCLLPEHGDRGWLYSGKACSPVVRENTLHRAQLIYICEQLLWRGRLDDPYVLVDSSS